LTDERKKPRVLVVGLGGVGGVCAAQLVRAGVDVFAVTGRDEIARVVVEHGLTVKIDADETKTPMAARAALAQGDGPFDVMLLATPPNAMVDAARAALPFLKDAAPIVCFQNGLAEERMSEVFPASRIVGGIVAYGASMTAPGVVEKTSEGGYTVGRLSGEIDDTVRFIGSVLEKSESVELTQNLRGARWSKLAINCAISSLGTIGGGRLGALMRHRFVRRLCLETMTEVVQVALLSGVKLEKVSGTLDLEWLALSDDERLLPGSPSLLAKHTVLLAVGAKYRRLRSSMLGAIERGREPPVEYLNGEVVRRGHALGVAVPINDALMATVLAISRGEKRSSLETLRALFDETRSTLRDLKLAA
jgi:2-dehydropantoate 2-reductase